MKVIGLVGGVASGKSTVAREFARLGAVVLDADEAAHRALDDPDVKNTLAQRWGDDILLANGKVDRQAVARKVFGDGPTETERQFLESLVHPRVRRDLQERMRELDRTGTPAVVLDVPLLVEVGWEDMCDVVFFVDVPRGERLRRAKIRGWSEEDLARREAAQADLEHKRRAADRVIRNAGSLDDLRREVDGAWSDVTGIEGKAAGSKDRRNGGMEE